MTVAGAQSRVPAGLGSDRAPVEGLEVHVPDDPVYRAVLKLRRPGELLAEVSDAWGGTGDVAEQVRIIQTHYKPFRRARLVAEVIGRNGAQGISVRQYLFIQVYGSLREARARFDAAEKKHTLTCTGPPIFLMADVDAVAWSLPNGPRLRPAKIGFRPGKFRKFMRRRKMRRYLLRRGFDPLTLPRYPQLPELIRLVPRRRALFRYEVPGAERPTTLFIKVYEPGESRRVRKNLKMMVSVTRRGQLGFRVPKLVTFSARRRAMVMKALPGRQLSEACEPDLFPALGRALAGLHGSAVEPDARWSPDRELSALRGAMDDVKRALPALAALIDSIVAELARLRDRIAFDDDAPIHGNLFGDQILVDGDKLGIVDWDDLCRGDPMHDVGRLMAHLIFLWQRTAMPRPQRARNVQRLLDAYSGATGRPLPETRLRWQTATALLMRAKISALRPLPPTWIEDISACVDEARRLLQTAECDERQ